MSQKRERNLKRENEVRRKETAKRREDKVIVGYIKTKYPKVYEEALNFTHEIDRANPTKLDLTKTPQFRAMLKEKKSTFTDNMELKIELMNEGKQSTAETWQDLQPLSDEDFKSLLDDLNQDPDIQSFFNNIEFELDNCPLW